MKRTSNRTPIRLAIAGVGNCASALVQGVSYYRQRPNENRGLSHRKLAGFDAADFDFVAAFDIDERKVGKSLSSAIFADPNVATQIESDIFGANCIVSAAPVLDGLPDHMLSHAESERFVVSELCSRSSQSDVVETIRDARPDFLICYLPVGSVQAVSFFAECALAAGVSFVNAMPVFVASDPYWVKRFEQAGLLAIGDDVKSQVGATIVHRALARLYDVRGVAVDGSFQVNFAGNTDFLNMMDRDRLSLKWKSKIDSVQSILTQPIHDLYAGPAEYIRHLRDRKIAFIEVEGVGFGGTPVKTYVRLDVQDSTNSAGVMVDVLRIAAAEAADGSVGTIPELCAYGFKHPGVQYPDGQLFDWFADWISVRDVE